MFLYAKPGNMPGTALTFSWPNPSKSPAYILAGKCDITLAVFSNGIKSPAVPWHCKDNMALKPHYIPTIRVPMEARLTNGWNINDSVVNDCN